MSAFCWFALFSRAPVLPEPEFLRATPGSSSVLQHTPASTSDPYLDDGPPPPLALQVFFPAAEAMEAALAGHLRPLAELPGAAAVQQAMVARRIPVPGMPPCGTTQCTYLVSYEGEADDPAAWLEHYVRQHTPIMARFPGVRQVEVYSRMDSVGGLPWPRALALQRNKVVFDDADALSAALNSPVRHEMRADFAGFPPFRGANTHFPMTTRVLL